MFHVCLCYSVCSFQHCGHLLEKGWPLGSLVCCVFLRLWYFPILCSRSGVILDCIDSWSLNSSLLCVGGLFAKFPKVPVNGKKYVFLLILPGLFSDVIISIMHSEHYLLFTFAKRKLYHESGEQSKYIKTKYITLIRMLRVYFGFTFNASKCKK